MLRAWKAGSSLRGFVACCWCVCDVGVFFTKGSNVGECFICFVFFHGFWSLEVSFSEILVSLGRLWTCFLPRGVQGADVGERVRSSGPFLAPFRGYFWSETVMFWRCFFRCVFWWFFIGFVVVLGLLFRGFWIIVLYFFQIVNLWKLAPRPHESSIFKVWRGLVVYIFVIVGGLVSGWLREWILSDFGMDFGSISASKIDEKRDRFREWFLNGGAVRCDARVHARGGAGRPGCDPAGSSWGASVWSIFMQNMYHLSSGSHILRRQCSRGPLYIVYIYIE